MHFEGKPSGVGRSPPNNVVNAGITSSRLSRLGRRSSSNVDSRSSNSNHMNTFTNNESINGSKIHGYRRSKSLSLHRSLSTLSIRSRKGIRGSSRGDGRRSMSTVPSIPSMPSMPTISSLFSSTTSKTSKDISLPHAGAGCADQKSYHPMKKVLETAKSSNASNTSVDTTSTNASSSEDSHHNVDSSVLSATIINIHNNFHQNRYAGHAGPLYVIGKNGNSIKRSAGVGCGGGNRAIGVHASNVADDTSLCKDVVLRNDPNYGEIAVIQGHPKYNSNNFGNSFCFISSMCTSFMPCCERIPHAADFGNSDKYLLNIGNKSFQDNSSYLSCDLKEVITEIECTFNPAYEGGKNELLMYDQCGLVDQAERGEDDEGDYDERVASDTLNLGECQMGNDALDISLPQSLTWVHRPLLLVATPNSGMTVRRVRRVCDPCYFDFSEEGTSPNLSNSAVIQLPINNGKEPPQQSLAIDFETQLFAGTAFFRIRGSETHTEHSSISNDKNGTTGTNNVRNPHTTQHDYFAKYNRKFQMVIRGKFKTPDVIMADCMSGLLLDRPLVTTSTASHSSDSSTKSRTSRRLRKGCHSTGEESLPPKWVLRAAVKVAGFFSPRMDADLECAHPRVLSPLCSMAQTIYVRRGSLKLEGELNTHSYDRQPQLDELHSEPHPLCSDSIAHKLVHKPSKKLENSSNWVQCRKRAFDAIYDGRVIETNESAPPTSATTASSPCFDPGTEYTFEFLQHLIDYSDLSIDLGMALGKFRLGGALRGQPVRIISAKLSRDDVGRKEGGRGTTKLDNVDCLWSFDLWHEALHVEE